ncbi:MAG: T9SS type A sorting domain-containing protein, partial [Ignavibacteriaceae bacterium]|nr:T9SS type A sorting domain-containing protein [Ignavibacteriaceae bacterium]
SLYDLNLDGNLEIILRAMPENTNINGIYAFDYSANLLANFPFPIESGHPNANVAIADMDGDSIPEIAFGNVMAVDSAKVWVWNLKGNLLKNYPQKVYATWVDGSVALADVSGDSLPDVIAPTNDGLIYAFDKNGSLVSGFPLEAENVYVVKGFNTSPTVIDIDGDGDIEIFAASLNKRVYGWDTPGIANKNIWSTFKGNAQRTGGKLFGYREPTVIHNINFTPLSFSLKQNYPNPFNPTTTIEYTLVATEFVSLKVFDLLGREVASLVNSVKQSGNYKINFDGSFLTSGIYFYTLSTENFKATNKMILLR